MRLLALAPAAFIIVGLLFVIHRSNKISGEQEETSYGLWQINQSTGTASGNAKFTFDTYAGAAAEEAASKARLEERRRVRVFEQHQVIDDEVLSDYHEWIERPKRITVRRDSLCRENHDADRTWVLWVCNNPLCPAYAYVAEEKITEVTQGWLDKAAPKPGSSTVTYHPWSVYDNAAWPTTTFLTPSVLAVTSS